MYDVYGVYVVPKVLLNGPCDAGDECLSQLAQCVRGLCRCNEDYYDRQGVCGKSYYYYNNDNNNYKTR